MRHRLVLLAVMLCSHAGAQVYKCAEGGTTVYSELPCGASAKAVTVRPASGHAPAAAPDRLAARPQEPSLSDRADAAVKRRLLDDEIWRKERAVSLLYDELAARQAQLRDRKQLSRNNLAGATWEQSISEEMKAVAAEYDIKIRGAQTEVEALKRRRDDLIRR